MMPSPPAAVTAPPSAPPATSAPSAPAGRDGGCPGFPSARGERTKHSQRACRAAMAPHRAFAGHRNCATPPALSIGGGEAGDATALGAADRRLALTPASQFLGSGRPAAGARHHYSHRLGNPPAEPP